MKYLLSLLMMCSLVNTASAQTKDETAVANAIEALRKAMIDPTKATLDKIASPKLMYGHSGGKVEDKATFMQTLLSGASDFVTIDLTEQKIAVTGSTAVVHHKLSATSNDGGKPGTVQLYIMLTWAKEGGQWKLAGRQAVKVPQPQQ